MHWITRERPKIDRIACPWLILRFIYVDAEFHFRSTFPCAPLRHSLPALAQWS